MLRTLESLKEHWLTIKITEGKSIAFRPRGRAKTQWEDDVKHDLKSHEIYHWEK
jgi:hypothetical protein